MNFRMMILSFSLLSGPSLAREVCPAATIADLQRETQGATQLVFFASWCVSCKKHLEELRDDQILIASFDEKAAAEKVLQHFAKNPEKVRCFWDQDGSIAKSYDVKGLPAQRAIKNPHL